MRSTTLVPEELVRAVRREARSSKAPELIANTHEEFPGAARFLQLADKGCDHLCWIGAGSQYLNDRNLGKILDEVNRDTFFTDRPHSELVEQDAEVHRFIEQFLKGYEQAPVLVWLRGMVSLREVGTAFNLGGEVREEKVALSKESPFGGIVTMHFNDPAFSPCKLAIDTSRICWQDSLRLPPRRHWAFVTTRRHLRITEPERDPRNCYVEQLGIAKRCRDDDVNLHRMLYPVGLERAHAVVANLNDRTLQYGMECGVGTHGVRSVARESSALIAKAGLFDYVELMAWRLRQERTVSGGVCLLIDEIRFAMDRHTGRMLNIASGFDSFRRVFAEPDRTAWGMWLARRI